MPKRLDGNGAAMSAQSTLVPAAPRTRRVFPRCALMPALGALSLACSHRPPPVRTFDVAISVRSDEGTPVRGATPRGLLAHQPTIDLGTSGADGDLIARVTGAEGAELLVEPNCPEGYRGARPNYPVTLRSAASAVGPLKAAIVCARTARLAAVVVRTNGAANLPVTVDGRELARTDAAGIAHFLVKASANQSFEVGIDTSSERHLRPANPATTYKIRETDEIFVFDQAFLQEEPPSERPKRRRRARSVSARHAPKTDVLRWSASEL